jgi:hypothetical protein
MSETESQPSTNNGPPENSGKASKGFAAGFKSFSEGLWSLGQCLLAAFIAISIYWHWDAVASYASGWLSSATHVGFLTFSVERKEAYTAIDAIAEVKKKDFQIDKEFAKGAVVRSVVNVSAIFGAKILWVDPNPQNNAQEMQILTNMGIAPFQVNDTAGAIEVLPIIKPDLIISDVGRKEEPLPLEKCKVHYFDIPSGLPDPPKGQSWSIDQINADALKGTSNATGGFSMAERLASTSTKWLGGGYTNHAEPRILFYSGSNGGRVTNQCARLVTNRTDVLLQSIVSALETFRWDKLRLPTKEGDGKGDKAK